MGAGHHRGLCSGSNHHCSWYSLSLPSRLTPATDQADRHIETIRREDAEQLRAINTRLDAIQTVML